MTEELLIQLMNQINDEHIVHGSCEVKFTFHDGRIEFYELTSPEQDNHLFDSPKAYHAKDDTKALMNILRQLKELGGDYGFNPDYKTNPQGKMSCTLNSGRKRKTDKNVIWSWCGTDISFDKDELKYYEETFGAQLEQTNRTTSKAATRNVW